MDLNCIYPIKFHPLLQQKIWGGEKLNTILNKATEKSSVGESWELSAVEDNVSIVSNGVLKGKSLQDLIADYGADFLGQSNSATFGTEFPLLLKFIDASDDLSVQLHPNDALARKRHNSFGKTEMWYVMDSDPEAKLYIGFKEQLNRELYINRFQNGELLDVLNEVQVNSGDAFFIEAGAIHAIGKGVLLAEIQQSSDITYRVYDWGRKDANGAGRELHVEQAIEAFDFSKVGAQNLADSKSNVSEATLVSNTFFTVNNLKVDEEVARDLSQIDSFVCYMCVGGEGQVEVNGVEETFVVGETICLAAKVQSCRFSTGLELKVLEIYI